MDHTSAINTRAVERYVLGEMTIEQAEDFEKHYFECEACASEVSQTSLMFANGRAAVLEKNQAPAVRPELALKPAPKRPWLEWLKPAPVWTFATAALLAAVVYQGAVSIPALKAPQSLPAALILDGATRASTATLHHADPLYFAMASPAAAGASVSVEIRDTQSKPVRSGEVPMPTKDQPLQVYFPGKLAPGQYTLVVRESGRELEQFQFDVVP